MFLSLLVSASLSIASSDVHQFGYFWDAIDKDHVEEKILAAREEIRGQKEHWRNKVDMFLHSSELIFSPDGVGGVYFLSPLYVIKPEDENILSLHNPRHFGSPFSGKEHGPRTSIAGYESSQRDALCYEVAKILGMERITPQTVMGIVTSEQFFGEGDKEKLCSIQEYLPDTISLYDFIKQDGDTALIDQEDYEMANIFVWVIFDNDAHPRNFRLYQKGSLWGIKKIDNSLSFPEKNKNLTNFLPLLPQGQNKLSFIAKQKIIDIPLDKIEEKMLYFELPKLAIESMKARIRFLEELVGTEDLTFAQIEERLIAKEPLAVHQDP